jgi:hypothetical protein
MTKNARATNKVGTFKIDRHASAAISKVEGLSMSREMLRIFAKFDRAGLSHEERRKVLISKYGRTGS